MGKRIPATREDVLKKAYSKLTDLNQRLKNISGCYYIHEDGSIYLKSLMSITETVAQLRYPETIEPYLGAMILPNQFFDFYKKAKKTKLVITEDNTLEGRGKAFYFGQNDDSKLHYTLNVVNDPEDFQDDFLDTMIKPEMYKRFFQLKSDEYMIYPDKDEYTYFTEEKIHGLCDAKAIFMQFNGMELTFTKHLFLDIKKDDKIGIARYGYRPIEDDPNYQFIYTIKHDTELYTSHTIFSVAGKL